MFAALKGDRESVKLLLEMGSEANLEKIDARA